MLKERNSQKMNSQKVEDTCNLKAKVALLLNFSSKQFHPDFCTNEPKVYFCPQNLLVSFQSASLCSENWVAMDGEPSSGKFGFLDRFNLKKLLFPIYWKTLAVAAILFRPSLPCSLTSIETLNHIFFF